MTTRQQPDSHLDADQLNAFAEGVLSAPERALCLQHLAECARCRDIAFLAGASVPSEEPARAPVRRFPFAWWPALSIGAATLAAVVIAVMLLHHAHQNIPAAPIQIAIQSPTHPAPPPMTEAPANSAPPAESKTHSVPKPSPAQKFPPKPEPLISDNRQVNNAIALDSAEALKPTAGTQQLGGITKSQQGISNASTMAPAQPSQSQIHGSAQAAPAFTLRTYDGAVNGAVPLRAPDGSAQIAGTITDTSGAAVAHARVMLDLTSGTTHRETMTDGGGRFAISSLQPGKYQLQISSPGFTTQVREVELGTSQLARVDSKLAVGAVSETVTVQAAAPMLNTESASVQSELPNKAPLQTSVNSGSRTLALDSSGKLFLSKKAGKHWKAVHGPWKKSAVTNLSLTSDQQFKVTTAEGSWLSGDGEHWQPAS